MTSKIFLLFVALESSNKKGVKISNKYSCCINQNHDEKRYL